MSAFGGKADIGCRALQLHLCAVGEAERQTGLLILRGSGTPALMPSTSPTVRFLILQKQKPADRKIFWISEK
jgi:hypothetical protein